MKLNFISIKLYILDRFTNFFYETCVFAKYVKHIAKGPATRALITGKIICTDNIRSIILTDYNGSKYGLF